MTSQITEIANINTTYIKCAQFHQYSDGTRVLKIWYQEDFLNECEEVREGKYDRGFVFGAEFAKYAFEMIGFQNGIYPIDKRTEKQLEDDWGKHVSSAYRYGFASLSYKAWRAQIVPSF